LLIWFIAIVELDRLRSEEFDNFRKFGTSSIYSNSILTEDKYKRQALAAAAEVEAGDEYEDDEEEDEDKVDVGEEEAGRQFGNHMPSLESDSSVLSGDTYTMGSHASQKSMMSVLAMQRAKRQKLEQQRKKSIAAATEFGNVYHIN